ncbi:MAG: phosphomannomutase/phosphoglucomutase [Actinobacteria bacterium]|nr:phosphomannomutase/phosphoglucomutase [Actinomycetota bacterium]MCG2802038.1 phosphomannomutase/phosphoglucomutase [Cellulomonas sp.]
MSGLGAVVNVYDVRGRVPQDLDEESVTALAAAFADEVVLPDGDDTVVVGHDMRVTSPQLATAVVEGLAMRGVHVVELGLCSTDELYYASGVRRLPGVMVTASHHPAGWNGLKLCRAGAAPVAEDSGLVQVARRAEQYLSDGLPVVGELGQVSTWDVLVDYAAMLRGLVDLSTVRPLVVVVDAGNGMAGLTVPAVLGVDAGIEPAPVRVIEVHMRLDGRLPHRTGGPLEAESLADLRAAVLEHHADLGLAFDADADRCLVVDELGEAVSPSAITALIGLREVEREQRAGREATVIWNLITSRVVPDLMAAAGARTVRTRVGHSYVKREMAAAGAVFGGEHSGHYYFREFFYADDGLLAALHVLAALGEQQHPMSVLADLYQPYSASGEINLLVPDVDAAKDAVRRAYASGVGPVQVDELDGLTVSHWDGVPQWWFNVRESQTEPVLRLNVEAADEDIMIKVRDDVIALVKGGA